MRSFLQRFSVIRKIKENKIVRDTSLYSLGNLSSQGIALLLLPIFTRYLSTEEYGILDYTNSIKSILVVFSTLSLNSFVLRHYFKLNNDNDRNTLIGTVLIFVISFSGSLLLFELFLAPIVIRSLGIQVPFYPYFFIALINSFFESIFSIPLVFLRVKRKARLFVAATVGNSLLALILGLILVIHFEWGVLGRYYGVLVSNIIFSFLVYASVIFRHVPLSINRTFLREGFRFSAPLLPAAFAAMMMSSFDRIWLERHVSLSELGIYTIGCTLGTGLLVIVRAFYMAVEPEMFASFGRPDFNRRILALKNRFILSLSCAGALIIIFCREAVGTILHVDFLSTHTIIPFFVVGSVLRGSQTLINTVFHAFSRTKYEFYIAMIGLGLNISANIFLIPSLGIYGAAIASILTFTVTFCFSLALLGRLKGIRWDIASEILTISLIIAASLLIMKIDVESSLFQTIAVKLAAIVIVGLLLTWIRRNWPLASTN